MSIRRTLLRRASVLALAAAIVGTSALAPAVSAAPLDDPSIAETVNVTMNKPKVESDKEIPGLGDLGIGDLPIGDLPIGDFGSGDGGVEDIPIIGDVANTFKDAEPEEIVTGAVEFAGVAAETVVPLIQGFIK